MSILYLRLRVVNHLPETHREKAKEHNLNPDLIPKSSLFFPSSLCGFLELLGTVLFPFSCWLEGESQANRLIFFFNLSKICTNHGQERPKG